jgi:hypothetical protein
MWITNVPITEVKGGVIVSGIVPKGGNAPRYSICKFPSYGGTPIRTNKRWKANIIGFFRQITNPNRVIEICDNWEVSEFIPNPGWMAANQIIDSIIQKELLAGRFGVIQVKLSKAEVDAIKKYFSAYFLNGLLCKAGYEIDLIEI